MDLFVPLPSPVESDISARYAVHVFNEGDVIRKWREQRQLTVVDLAKRAGVDKNTITRAEASENTRTDTLRVIVEALGHTIDELHATLSGRDGLTSSEREHLHLWRALSESSRERLNGVVRMTRELEERTVPPSGSPTSPAPRDQPRPVPHTNSTPAPPQKRKRR